MLDNRLRVPLRWDDQIVRVWLEYREIEGAPAAWRGSIEHVASGKVKYLTALDEITRFIRPFLEAKGVCLSLEDPG